MPAKRTALLALLVLTALPAHAHALELGVQDDGRTSTAVAADVDQLHGGWTRTIAYAGQPGVAQRIRDAHTAGLKIILTVGGTGTRTRQPARLDVLRYIQSLPRADRYEVINEVDLSGMKPCTYRKLWLTVRSVLGTKLLYGAFSPHEPLTYTAAVLKCGPLPRILGVSLHPYQPNDPLAHSTLADWTQGGIGNLGQAERAFRGMGIRVRWWLTEFGYQHLVNRWGYSDDAQSAWLWPRAFRQAQRHHARVLIAYTAQGASWDTRPGPLAWCSMTLGRACPGAQAPVVHLVPEKHAIRQADPQMFAYASNK